MQDVGGRGDCRGSAGRAVVLPHAVERERLRADWGQLIPAVGQLLVMAHDHPGPALPNPGHCRSEE
jgi:hypothetical protein